ncbi:uncharacterized protein LOC114761504 [Neltuma alba]|uniref:uncharacterized protein LOC114761504 n=1 Tax=Neltuma alba TaxID=207710 RepID=UPI0010A4AA19|nr:uncharacterized protein LOC114761504 [Prosopis alba]
MGNCFGRYEYYSGLAIVGAMAKQSKVVRVAKLDGKILEFSSPVLVKDVLKNFPELHIGASNKASESEHLSPDYELRAGRLYYLLNPQCDPPSNVSSAGNRELTNGSKRVKIVITRKQLEMLVSKQISLEDVLSQAHDRTSDLPSSWKPKLDSIPEGFE